MHFENGINPDLEIPGVPGLIRANLLRRAQGQIARVLLEHEASRGVWSRVNILKIGGTGGGGKRQALQQDPESVDELSEAVVRMMHAHWSDNKDQDGYIPQYKIIVEAKADSTRGVTRNYFFFKYAPGESDQQAERMEELETQWAMQAMEMQRSQIDTLTVQNQQLHDTVIKLAELSSAPVNAAVDMFNQGVGIFTSGANMLVEAQRTQFSTEAVKIEQEAKNKRIERVMGVVEKPLATMFGQFSTWAVKKWLDGGDDVIETTAQEQPRVADVTQAQPVAADAQAQSAAVEEAEPEHPLAMMFEAFGATITPKQRKDMNEHLTKVQVRLLDELFCAPTDDGALAAWDAAVADMPAEKWVWLAGQLAEDQSENLNKARTIVTRIKAELLKKKKAEKAEKKEQDE